MNSDISCFSAILRAKKNLLGKYLVLIKLSVPTFFSNELLACSSVVLVSLSAESKFSEQYLRFLK